MAQWYAYKTKAGIIFVIGLSTDNEGTTRIVALDHNIPPSKAELIDAFQADSECDYINHLIPILFKNLKDDPDVIEIYDQLIKEGL